MVLTCLPFIRSGKNHLARHCERGEEDKADKGTTSENGQAWSSQVPEGSGEQGKMEEADCRVKCKAPTIPAVKGQVRVTEEDLMLLWA